MKLSRPHFTFEQIREYVLLGLGVVITVYETFVEHADRPQLLILAAGLLGLPTFLKRDEKPEKKETPPDAPAPGTQPPVGTG